MLLGIDDGQPLRMAAGGAAFLLLAYFIARLNRERGIGVRRRVQALAAAGPQALSAA